ncbi:MAG: DUF3891 family protein, partial [Actinobacteria bacterium]|nr:DUF3891 family protein [Actinomycetota bacterium]
MDSRGTLAYGGAMIVREQGDHWHVVLQPEHALLSEEVALAWSDRGGR